MDRVYFDHNATSPLRGEARAAMLDAMAHVGNPSSVHAEGRAARAIVSKARADIAELIGVEAAGVTFTSGGSEANASVLTPRWSAGGNPFVLDHLVVSATEHPSVLAGGRFGAEAISQTPVDSDGVVDVEALDRFLGSREGAALVSVMAANNETGVLQPLADIVRVARAHGAMVHSDAVQVAGRLPLDVMALGVDVVTLSAHKLGGPPGIGAVARVPGAANFAPLVTGGSQEARLRAGTENVGAIAGFGAALRSADTSETRRAAWQDQIARLEREIGNQATIFGAGAPRLPQTLCFGIDGMSAETLVIALDLAGVAVSSGSACSSGRVGPSHVLAAMQVPGQLAKSAIRVSLGWDSSEKDLDLFAIAWRNVIKQAKLRHTSAVLKPPNSTRGP